MGELTEQQSAVAEIADTLEKLVTDAETARTMPSEHNRDISIAITHMETAILWLRRLLPG